MSNNLFYGHENADKVAQGDLNPIIKDPLYKNAKSVGNGYFSAYGLMPVDSSPCIGDRVNVPDMLSFLLTGKKVIKLYILMRKSLIRTVIFIRIICAVQSRELNISAVTESRHISLSTHLCDSDTSDLTVRPSI